jgi:L-amino acid N-acyltransferase YncA
MITVRPATPQDADQMAALLNAIIETGGTTAFQSERTAQDIIAMTTRDAKQSFCHVAIEDGNKVVGFQYVNPSDHLSATTGDIASFVAEGQQGKGIGGALISATREKALAVGFTEINATIRADNVPGLAYYSRIGFLDYDIAKDVPLSDGTLVDRISKRLKL